MNARKQPDAFRSQADTQVVDRTTTYTQQLLEEPAAGAALICCAAPVSDIALDL